MLRILKTLSFILLLSAFLWMAGFISFLVNISAIKPANMTQKTDAIVVLTGGNYRIYTGLDLWRQNLAPELFITGVHPDVSRRDIMAAWEEEKRLPLCCLTLGHEATTTRENAIETKEWVKNNYVRSARLVTSTYHIPRAVLEFKSAIPDLEIIPHPVQKSDYLMDEARFWVMAFIEYNKSIARRIEIYSGKDLFE